MTSVIADGVSAENREMIQDFLGRYPSYQVYASVVYVGFTSAGAWDLEKPENRHEFVQVYDIHGKSLNISGSAIAETLFHAEVAIAESRSTGGRVEFDPALIDRYLPQDVREAGWRGRHFWKGIDENIPWGPYRIGLANDQGEVLAIEWDRPSVGLELLVEDARVMQTKRDAT